MGRPDSKLPGLVVALIRVPSRGRRLSNGIHLLLENPIMAMITIYAPGGNLDFFQVDRWSVKDGALTFYVLPAPPVRPDTQTQYTTNLPFLVTAEEPTHVG